MTRLTRRAFFVAPLFIEKRLVKDRPAPLQSHTIITPKYQVQLTIEYHDRYRSAGFGFKDDRRSFCLGRDGATNRACLEGFVGSLAVVHFHITPNGLDTSGAIEIREHVRMIDRHDRIPERPAYDKTVELSGGIGSDIQAFGYEVKSVAEARDDDDAWCLYRQDLRLGGEADPFVTLHWKHTLPTIRLLDVIAGNGTKLIG